MLSTTPIRIDRLPNKEKCINGPPSPNGRQIRQNVSCSIEKCIAPPLTNSPPNEFLIKLTNRMGIYS